MAASKSLSSVGLLGAVATMLPSILLSAAAVSAAKDPLLIDCYRWDGAVTANNTKCPNSNACCGPTATCLSNHLCANVGDGPNLWVRGPCAVKGWDPECAQICKYNETRGVFPRVAPCSDGSLCCNNDPQCCQDGKGIFLDESGNRASAKATAATTSYPPVSDGLSRFTLTPSTSTTSTSTSSASTTIPDAGAATTLSSTTPTPTPAPSSSSSDDSIGLKVGLGLGIPLAVLATACAGYLFLRRRNRRADDVAAAAGPQYRDQPYGEVAQSAGYPYSPGTTVYSGAPKPAVYGGQQYPAEIMGQTAIELDGSQYGPRERHELS
ncbi:hypothetical protein C8A01DRAFT_20861 [Parachaetomium inaequale]|uniref:Uncharacterized protein n=1 Tax=Parachaetomium inaequale TaxID=2588326 RepID=A0AAN6P9N2_9PEZI|nr:hypothetical protein C8A01DRAFT_20861 [Parachaetomium inaequale]